MLCNAKFRKCNVSNVTEDGATDSVFGSDAHYGSGNENGGKTPGNKVVVLMVIVQVILHWW